VLHLVAMFGPALLLGGTAERWSSRKLSAVCALCLAAGAVCVLWAAAPWNLLGLAIAHGAAWGLAWAGQLWAPERRSRAGASPWRAAVGYALLTLAFGAVVANFGAQGVAATHAALGLAACAAWLLHWAATIDRLHWRHGRQNAHQRNARGHRP
jgi:MFS family permease